MSYTESHLDLTQNKNSQRGLRYRFIRKVIFATVVISVTLLIVWYDQRLNLNLQPILNLSTAMVQHFQGAPQAAFPNTFIEPESGRGTAVIENVSSIQHEAIAKKIETIQDDLFELDQAQNLIEQDLRSLGFSETQNLDTEPTQRRQAIVEKLQQTAQLQGQIVRLRNLKTDLESELN